jgi:soluble lytic murein transglycosylase
LASYNAGDHKAKEWIDIRGNMGVVEFIESIPYNETRNYVKKILETTLYTSLI